MELTWIITTAGSIIVALIVFIFGMTWKNTNSRSVKNEDDIKQLYISHARVDEQLKAINDNLIEIKQMIKETH